MKPVYKIRPFYTDDRGEMSHLLEGNTVFTSALLITCKKGSIRANHYHKHDTHYSFLLEGKMEYYYRNHNAKNKKLHEVIVEKGEIVHTPPMVEHAMKFLQDSVFLALTTEPRKREDYERDTIRIKLI
ncbi:MAG: cupin domain-containing protein [Candidatus Levybacteria bacterium]|nr:cupin domain-containing protein [Candidatus Levybacteria bacterium]